MTSDIDKKLIFPHGFLWGAATAAHQVEGNNHNDWTEWEKKNASRLSREGGGKYPPENYISGTACDHYNRYEEDFDLAKTMGHNAHRFSIEWSRIEPEEGKFNELEIEHYRNVIRALCARGIEPFVTLWHWTNPLWVQNMGGWENPKTIDYFVRFAEKISTSIKDVKFWIPINEPTVYVGHSYIIGVFPPQVKSFFRGNKVLKNLIEAHKRTYIFLHKSGDNIKVGSSFNLHYHVPVNKCSLLDRLATKVIDYFRDIRPLNFLVRYSDFIGMNYYYRDSIKFVLGGGRFGIIDIRNENKWVSDMGWEIYPEGIYHLLKRLAKYKKPIYITENGIADAKDEYRAEFIVDHLKWVHKGISEGVDIRGYLHWSLLDNFEWDKGFWPRFGLVDIDYKTLERKRRLSSYVYEKIARSNTIEIDEP